MFHKLLNITVLFRIINFAAFIGFFAFLFKQRLLPSIKKQIQEKNLLLQNLEHQKQGIRYQHSNLDNALEQQKHLADELIKKINLWHARVEEKQAHAYEEEKKIVAKLQEKKLIQTKEQAFVQLNKNIVPNALSYCEENLAQQFAHNDQGQSYIDDIVTFLQESNA